MRLLCLSSILALTVACGSSDDDDNGNNTIDAAAIDAPTADIDAPPNANTFDLTVNLNMFGMAHNNQTVFFDLWDDADTGAAVASDSVDIMGGGGGGGGGGGNTVAFSDGLIEGHAYKLYLYADVNGNMACDGPAGNMDHAWVMTIPAVAAAVVEDYAHNDTFDGDCTKH